MGQEPRQLARELRGRLARAALPARDLSTVLASRARRPRSRRHRASAVTGRSTSRRVSQYLEGEGRREHDETQAAIFDAGVYGVPSYVVNEELFFGREHLPRVCWLAQGHEDPTQGPDVAYCSSTEPGPPSTKTPGKRTSLPVAIDFTEPQCYLALQPLRQLASDLDLTIDWQPFIGQPRDVLGDLPDGNDRGSRHRRARARYVLQDLERYATSQGLELCGSSGRPTLARAPSLCRG